MHVNDPDGRGRGDVERGAQNPDHPLTPRPGPQVGRAESKPGEKMTPEEQEAYDAGMRLRYERMAFTFLNFERWREQHGNDDW